MARGSSGRVVLEIDPALKGDLYVVLANKNLTLREWFILQAQRFIDDDKNQSQMRIPFQQTTDNQS